MTEISDNIRTYEFFLISSVGTKAHPAFDVLCYPSNGGCLRKLKLTEENAIICIEDHIPMPYLCEVLNEDHRWEYELFMPKKMKLKNIPDFDAAADAIIRIYPEGMVFPDMFENGMPCYEWEEDNSAD